MNNYYKTYFNSAITQARGLVQKLKAQDPNYHASLNPISVFKDIPINLLSNHHLIDLFKTEFNKDITLVRVKHDSFVKAFIKQYDDRCEIYTTRHNSCWTRFYVCKELSQMLIYSEANLTCTTEDMNELFSHLINGMPNDSNAQISADWIAYLVAMEFLLPSAVIPELLKLKGISNNLIAKKMLTPEKIVDFRLSARGQDLFAID